MNRDRVSNNLFDLQKNFHEDRLSFPVYGEKINLGHFRPFLRLAVLKVQNFCQNWSSGAEKLATSLFLYGESEKIGPEMICRPSRFQLMRFFLTTTLNNTNFCHFLKEIFALRRISYTTFERSMLLEK